MIDGVAVKPCLQCGYCCVTGLCGVGRFGPDGLCAELHYRDGKWWCGLLENLPEGREAEVKFSTVLGGGCSSTLFNEWRRKIPTPAEVEAYRKGRCP